MSLEPKTILQEEEENSPSTPPQTSRSSKSEWTKTRGSPLRWMTGINLEAIRRMVKNKLGLKQYKLQKVQLLTDENKRMRLQRCRQLQYEAVDQQWGQILFTDEKLFTVKQTHNHQNDRCGCAQAPGTSTHSVMVWVGFYASGKTPLVFVDQGIKIDQKINRFVILESVVLFWN